MKILLTGAGGWIGLHAVRELLDGGHDVTALVRSPGRLGPLARSPGLTVFEADLERPERVAAAVEGQDVCVHAAFLWGEPGSELEMRDTAVAAKLFDAAGRAGVSRCIHLSSTAVHRPFAGEMGEEDRLRTADLYGATKAAGELVLRAACAQHGMTGVVLRPGPVVGRPAFEGASFRSDRRLEEMVTAAVRGLPIEVVEGEGRQFVDVAAVARATRLLACADAPHATYVCVDREILTWVRIARTVVACLDSRSEVRILPRGSHLPVPRFRTERIEELLGGPQDSRHALEEHVRHLARAS